MATVTGEKSGGRIKGSANKKTVEVIETLAKMKCDPITGMAKIAMGKSALDAGAMRIVKKIRAALKGEKDQLEFFELLLTSWRKSSPELQAKMFSELAQYIYPKRKAIEVTGPGGNPVPVEVIQRTIVDPKGK